MSVHDDLFRESAIPLIRELYDSSNTKVIYCPLDDDEFELDVAIGPREYRDEQATGGDYKEERRTIRVATSDLEAQDIHTVQANATVRVDDIEYNIDLAESTWDQAFVRLRLVHQTWQRRPQMRRL